MGGLGGPGAGPASGVSQGAQYGDANWGGGNTHGMTYGGTDYGGGGQASGPPASMANALYGGQGGNEAGNFGDVPGALSGIGGVTMSGVANALGGVGGIVGGILGGVFTGGNPLGVALGSALGSAGQSMAGGKGFGQSIGQGGLGIPGSLATSALPLGLGQLASMAISYGMNQGMQGNLGEGQPPGATATMGAGMPSDLQGMANALMGGGMDQGAVPGVGMIGQQAAQGAAPVAKGPAMAMQPQLFGMKRVNMPWGAWPASRTQYSGGNYGGMKRV